MTQQPYLSQYHGQRVRLTLSTRDTPVVGEFNADGSAYGRIEVDGTGYYLGAVRKMEVRGANGRYKMVGRAS